MVLNNDNENKNKKKIISIGIDFQNYKKSISVRIVSIRSFCIWLYADIIDIIRYKTNKYAQRCTN